MPRPAAAVKPSARWTVAGAVSAAIGFPAAAFFLLLTAVTANPCALGGACDTYGEPAAGFVWFATLSILALAVACGGIVVAVTSAVLRRRCRSRQRRPRT